MANDVAAAVAGTAVQEVGRAREEGGLGGGDGGNTGAWRQHTPGLQNADQRTSKHE